MTTSTAQQIPLTRSRRHAGLARAALAILMPVGQFAIAVSGFAMRRLTVAAGNTRRLARYVGSAAIRSPQPASSHRRAAPQCRSSSRLACTPTRISSPTTWPRPRMTGTSERYLLRQMLAPNGNRESFLTGTCSRAPARRETGRYRDRTQTAVRIR